jgi:3D (Asp-Asp-Asp) domain-containing protein
MGCKYRSGKLISVRVLYIYALVLVAFTFLFTYTVLSYSHNSKVRTIQHKFRMDSLEESSKMKSIEAEILEYRTATTNSSRKKRRSLGIFNVTAYDPIESCKPFDDGITSVGLPVGMGVAAVDPKVVPYGSVLYIPELERYFFASDTGAAMKRGNGRNLDILMPTVKEALIFGRKHLKVELVDLAKR